MDIYLPLNKPGVTWCKSELKHRFCAAPIDDVSHAKKKTTKKIQVLLVQISASTYLYRGILFPYFSLAISIQKQEALHSPRTQTSAVTNVKNVRQFSQVWNSVPQNVPEYSLCHAEPVLKISWNLFACLSVCSEKSAEKQTNQQIDGKIAFAVRRR